MVATNSNNNARDLVFMAAWTVWQCIVFDTIIFNYWLEHRHHSGLSVRFFSQSVVVEGSHECLSRKCGTNLARRMILLETSHQWQNPRPIVSAASPS
jgi:hypothetical protein